MFTTRYVQELPGTYTRVMPTPLSDPYWVGWNQSLAAQINLPVTPDAQLLEVMSGRSLFNGHDPIAQKYAGHQFGGWNPELGDGRGLLLGEWRDEHQQHWEFHLKGAGKTPYSRFGDGRAVLRSSIREFLGSEALHALRIPTTRALGLMGSSERIQRETIEPGATLLRVSHSHVRFGHFEWFAFSNQIEQLDKLVEYVIRHHYPHCAEAKDPVIELFDQVIDRTAHMIAGWMAYGFVHGVMNTDNMSILGETFDYGPYAFLDTTRMNAVFNHTDERGRYAFDQQPSVGLWNLQRLGQALSALTDARSLALRLQRYESQYQAHYHAIMNLRLGGSAENPIDRNLVDDWVAILATEGKDFHQWFRLLSDRPVTQWSALSDDFIDRNRFRNWFERVKTQVQVDDEERMLQMQRYNPVTVARTHHLQDVIDAAHAGDLKPFDSLYAALQSPFETNEEWRIWQSAPAASEQSVSLSCSS